ncbi:hypothetical protein [Schinkia azotoformans]|uniref:hypothetical protein n=1 Tax=Schinkia azotoformans TaxID=1454 RepID=UPI0002DD683D|nr:hypothetical protein [Schinkia azotoformans]
MVVRLLHCVTVNCGDNAGMIAAAAYIEWKKGLENVQAGLDLNAKPSLVFEDM